MDIKITNDLNTEVLVINKFEGEQTSQELANTYAVEKDNFEGKLGTTYLLHTYGKIPADKILSEGAAKGCFLFLSLPRPTACHYWQCHEQIITFRFYVNMRFIKIQVRA